MATIMEGCQGRPRTPTITEKICPNCGEVIELFSIDTEVACEKCGFVAYNDQLSCVQWCKYAKACVGEQMYASLMAAADSRKRRRAG
ncbi:MAG: hypothetical protein IKQ10_01005 [Oscillospiraceae bacterium]|nr:hypothetical protein [Oscillospiraceae bacterium]